MASSFLVYYDAGGHPAVQKVFHYVDTLKEFTDSLAEVGAHGYMVIEGEAAIKISAVYRIEKADD